MGLWVGISIIVLCVVACGGYLAYRLIKKKKENQ